ncbi:MAG: hypothetical protein RQ732_10885 [Methylophaga sp.]|nr:hypothetical protein [Methylophaga sp.]
MKFFSLKLVLKTLLLGLMFSGYAQALTVTSNAFLDIANIRVTTLSGTASLTFSPFSSFVQTDIDSPEGLFSDVQFDFAGGSVNSILDNGAFITADASADEFIASASATTAQDQGFAIAFADSELEYVVSGNGQVRIDVDFFFDQFIADRPASALPGDGSAFGFVELFDVGSTTADNVDFFNETNGIFSTNGTLSVVLDVLAGDTDSLVFTAETDVFGLTPAIGTVPVPGTLWLMAPLALMAVRFRKAAA